MVDHLYRNLLPKQPSVKVSPTYRPSSLSSDDIGCGDDMGNDGDTGRARHKIVEEGARNVLHEESTRRSTHCYFHRGNIRTSKVRLRLGAADEMKENVHSKRRIGRDRSVLPILHDVEMPMVVHRVRDDYRSYSHARRNPCTLNSHNAEGMDHCTDCGVEEDLHNVMHLGSSGARNYGTLVMGSGALNRRRIQPQPVDEVCLELGNPKTHCYRLYFAELLSTVLLVFSFRNLEPSEVKPHYHLSD